MLCSFKIFPFYLISVFLFYINACKLRQLVCTPTLTDSIFGLFSVFILHFHLPFSLVQSLSIYPFHWWRQFCCSFSMWLVCLVSQAPFSKACSSTHISLYSFLPLCDTRTASSLHFLSISILFHVSEDTLH